jgi:hypothetical protein
LANIYLHHVFDLWTRWWRNKRARGEAIVVRYADDFIVGFERKDDAERYKEELAARIVVGGHTRYYDVPTNGQAIWEFRNQVGRHWHRALKRRSQTNAVTWTRTKRLIARYLPLARVCHPFPGTRFAVRTRGKSLVR